MSDIFDYLKWRGDLSFKADPFNEIDNLIFTQFCFLDMKTIIAKKGSSVTLREAVDLYYKGKTKKETKLGTLIPDDVNKLAKEIAATERFGNVLLYKYSSTTNTELKNEVQFAAVAAILPNSQVVISFRGTDDTLAGWKEDAYLALFPDIPAQRMALEFLEQLGREIDGRIIICGHSKGGNLSLYAAKNASDSIKDRIDLVFNDDGPGFGREFYDTSEYLKIKDKVRTIIPQSSVVGLIFEQDKDSLKIVHSTTIGVLQHNIFTWQLEGKSLVSDILTPEAKTYKETFNKWIQDMSYTEKQVFVDSLFGFLSSSGATTLSEAIGEKKPQLYKAYKESSKETRKMLVGIVKSLIYTGASKSFETASNLIKNKVKRDKKRESEDFSEKSPAQSDKCEKASDKNGGGGQIK